MRLYGRPIYDNYALTEVMVSNTDESLSFHQQLEKCLLAVCRELDISVPIWLDKNTTEFACFRRTFFMKDQFIDNIKFDKLEIQIELD